MAGEQDMIAVIQEAQGVLGMLRSDIQVEQDVYFPSKYSTGYVQRALNREMEYCTLAINSLKTIERSSRIFGGASAIGTFLSYLGDE